MRDSLFVAVPSGVVSFLLKSLVMASRQISAASDL
jgi:hypothetical protein